MKKYFLAVIILFIAISCSFNDGQEKVNNSELKTLITKAISGDKQANGKLSGLIDSDHIGKNQYNQLTVDAIKVNNKFFFAVTLEYPDPSLNIFAVYDENLKFYLLDKSLNGNISVECKNMDDNNLIFVQEYFLTKDVLKVSRFSIYKIQDTTVNLAYRSFAHLIKDQDTISQTITSLTNKYIITKINTTENPIQTASSDTFYYKSSQKKYLSKNNLFKYLVLNEINDFRWITIKPQLASNNNNGNTLEAENYSISLGKDWERVSKFTQTKYIKSKLTGELYFNNALHTKISVLQLPEGKKGEDYSLFKFNYPTNGVYKVRSTELNRQGENYVKIIEHSCGGNKYLLLLECPQNTYEKNKLIFENILDSFFIEC